MGNQAPHVHEPQVTDRDEEKIIQLLSALPRVKAPGDFGFRVKARIAEGKPASATSMWLPTAAKAALPFILLVLVGGYFAITALYTTDDVPAVAVAKQEEPAAALTQDHTLPVQPHTTVQEKNSPPVLTAQAPVETVNVPSGPSPTVAASRVLTKKRLPSAAGPHDGSGSKIETALIPKELSKANDPAVTPEASPKGERAGEVLTRIGVNALFGESGWKAESVTPNTTAAKAGIKAGDVIESVDDQTLTDLGSVAKPAKGKKLRVLRDGKSIDIVIDP